MKINVVCDNIKSNYEIDLLDGEYPTEPLPVPAHSIKLKQKYDIANWEEIDE
jgi:hypothetical protein